MKHCIRSGPAEEGPGGSWPASEGSKPSQQGRRQPVLLLRGGRKNEQKQELQNIPQLRHHLCFPFFFFFFLFVFKTI